MREADIFRAGEIMADGQAAGEMDGFRVTPAPGRAAAGETGAAPADEYALQAERFAAAPNGDISIARDGSVRWRGQLIAKLKAAEDILRPGFILLADAGLEGEAREKSEARLARFIAFHFETVCKPLYDLAAAEALFEKPRFVAQKIVEHLGIVPRRDIAAQVKELEQESRAALRRLGVRFGVYHIFMPMLLKPAAAQGLTLLWGLKNDALARPGYDDVIAYLAAGRTSFAVEEAFDRHFYRLAGYRLLGKKAVRIDMLERCADLIRLALAWSPAAAAETGASRPEGAYDGRHFTISQAMLSILGATPEDMEEMLEKLGYASQRISMEEYHAFLGAEGKAGAAAAVPEAEPVGDWSVPAPAEPVGMGGAAIGGLSGAGGLPAAEPVGPKFRAEKAAAPVAEKAEMLLWHYQKRHHRKPPHRDSGRAPRRGGQEPRRAAGEGEQAGKHDHEGRARHGRLQGARPQGQDKARKDSGRSERGQKDGARRFRRGGETYENGKCDGGKPRNFGAKKHDKPIKAEDSPFAALLALRDKMKK